MSLQTFARHSIPPADASIAVLSAAETFAMTYFPLHSRIVLLLCSWPLFISGLSEE
jgi:hypothetical protein